MTTSSTGRQSFQDELDRVRQLLNRDDHAPDDLVKLGVFRELVKPRESMFQFSHVATVLSDDPAAKLEELVDRLVNRQLANARKDHEMADDETGFLEFAKAPMNREPIPAR